MTDISSIDYPDALVVRTRKSPSLLESGLSAAAVGVFAGVAGALFVGRVPATLLGVLGGVLGFLYSRRTRRFELRVARDELVAIGRVGDGLENSRSVPASEIRWLEYQEDSTGPETADHPAGLYAVLKHRSVCLLPDVDFQQTASVIERIEEKFPELRAQWAGSSAFGKDFISLGL